MRDPHLPKVFCLVYVITREMMGLLVKSIVIKARSMIKIDAIHCH